MRFVLGLLSGCLGMLAGWAGLAFVAIALAGPDRDGGIAMGAVFMIGPIGGVVGFVAGVWAFISLGVVRERAPAAEAAASPSLPKPARTRISRPFAVVVIALAGGIAWWAWYELIRSPYLTHGFMTLDLQFRLPPGALLPVDANDVHIDVEEGDRLAIVTLDDSWRGHAGDRPGILARASLSYKASRRVVRLDLPGFPAQAWRLDLASDPDPTPEYSPWRSADSPSATPVEMSFRLSADR